MAVSLFKPEGAAALAGFISPDTLFAFDIDGTLAPIVDDYKAAKVDDYMKKTLMRLAGIAKVAVITGRSRDAALSVLGFEPHLLIGNHGAELPDDYKSKGNEFTVICGKWREQLEQNLLAFQGIEMEFKGESLSLHYRKSVDQQKALAILNAEIEKLEPKPRIVGGKSVINLMPMEAFTKGNALIAAMNILKSDRAIYVGDDETDEEVFRLENIDILGIHIGVEDETAAQYYLSQQSELILLLNSIVNVLEEQS